jgi:hypothetical protein
MWTCFQELKRLREIAEINKPESAYIERSKIMEHDLLQGLVKLNRIDIDIRALERRCLDLEIVNLNLKSETQNQKTQINNLIEAQ